jgi:hypothetical protein
VVSFTTGSWLTYALAFAHRLFFGKTLGAPSTIMTIMPTISISTAKPETPVIFSPSLENLVESQRSLFAKVKQCYHSQKPLSTVFYKFTSIIRDYGGKMNMFFSFWVYDEFLFHL